MMLKCRPKQECLLTVNDWKLCINLHMNQIWIYTRDKDNIYHISCKFVLLKMNQSEFEKYFEEV